MAWQTRQLISDESACLQRLLRQSVSYESFQIWREVFNLCLGYIYSRRSYSQIIPLVLFYTTF